MLRLPGSSFEKYRNPYAPRISTVVERKLTDLLWREEINELRECKSAWSSKKFNYIIRTQGKIGEHTETYNTFATLVLGGFVHIADPVWYEFQSHARRRFFNDDLVRSSSHGKGGGLN